TLDRPLRHGLELGVRIVVPGDEQRRHLEPHARLVPQILERLEHRLQVPAAYFPVERLGETLEIDVGRVHAAKQLLARRVADVARGHGDRAHAVRPARFGDVDRVLEKDRRVVVGEGDARAAEAARGPGDRRRVGAVGERVPFARLADVPVLAELAGEIAAGGPERQHRSPGQEVVERLLLDRVDAEAARASPGREHDRAFPVGAHETQAALAFVQPAVARTGIALYAPVVERVPVAGRREGFLAHDAPLDDPRSPAFRSCPGGGACRAAKPRGTRTLSASGATLARTGVRATASPSIETGSGGSVSMVTDAACTVSTSRAPGARPAARSAQ